MTKDYSSNGVERGLLDHLLSEAKLYHNSSSFKELLSFVVKLRNVAPFNAMILQLQKPGVTYVASAYDWWERFERKPKPNARPLLILWPFAPVVTVYDVIDTEGKELPEDAEMFPARGEMNEEKIKHFVSLVKKSTILVDFVDQGDARAGQIERTTKCIGNEEKNFYKMAVNRNHKPPAQFTTIAHELGHLFLGHLGVDKSFSIPKRRCLSHSQDELEAESVAYIVCERNGVTAKSEKYLASFIEKESELPTLDVYQIMRAANQIETLLELHEHTKFPSKTDRLGSNKIQQLMLF